MVGYRTVKAVDYLKWFFLYYLVFFSRFWLGYIFVPFQIRVRGSGFMESNSSENEKVRIRSGKVQIYKPCK